MEIGLIGELSTRIKQGIYSVLSMYRNNGVGLYVIPFIIHRMKENHSEAMAKGARFCCKVMNKFKCFYEFCYKDIIKC